MHSLGLEVTPFNENDFLFNLENQNANEILNNKNHTDKLQMSKPVTRENNNFNKNNQQSDRPKTMGIINNYDDENEEFLNLSQKKNRQVSPYPENE